MGIEGSNPSLSAGVYMSYTYETSSSEILKVLCKQKNKFGMFISFDPGDVDWALDPPYKDAPWLKKHNDDHMIMLFDGTGYIFADTLKEINNLYKQTYGDENGGKCYALTCNSEGQLLTENT